MAEDKTAPATVGTNPLALPWPTDPHGLTTFIKREGTKAVQRLNGDKAKFDVFMATVTVLVKHAREKYAAQREANAARMREQD